MSDAKRSHPAIPLSPPSPPADGVRERTESSLPDYAPRSPASPYMSTTKSYGPSFIKTQSSSVPTAAQRSPSPPTSAPMSTQVSQQSSMTAITSHPHPENNVIGQARKVPEDFEDEERARKRLRVDEQVDDTQKHQSPHEPSMTEIDHDTTSWSTAAHFVDTQITVPTCHETQDGANATSQTASDEMDLDQLHRNVGEIFHLCKSGKVSSACASGLDLDLMISLLTLCIQLFPVCDQILACISCPNMASANCIPRWHVTTP